MIELLFIVLILWFGSGAVPIFFAVKNDMEDGVGLTIKDIFIALLLSCFGLVILGYFLSEAGYWDKFCYWCNKRVFDKVLIRGKDNEEKEEEIHSED